MKDSKPAKAEKCGICFFVNKKAIFTLVRTNNQEFNDDLLKSTYLEGKFKKK